MNSPVFATIFALNFTQSMSAVRLGGKWFPGNFRSTNLTLTSSSHSQLSADQLLSENKSRQHSCLVSHIEGLYTQSEFLASHTSTRTSNLFPGETDIISLIITLFSTHAAQRPIKITVALCPSTDLNSKVHTNGSPLVPAYPTRTPALNSIVSVARFTDSQATSCFDSAASKNTDCSAATLAAILLFGDASSKMILKDTRHGGGAHRIRENSTLRISPSPKRTEFPSSTFLRCGQI